MITTAHQSERTYFTSCDTDFRNRHKTYKKETDQREHQSFRLKTLKSQQCHV